MRPPLEEVITDEMLDEIARLGGYHFRNGARSYKAWVTCMREDLAEDRHEFEPYLREAWRRIAPLRRTEVSKVVTSKDVAPPIAAGTPATSPPPLAAIPQRSYRHMNARLISFVMALPLIGSLSFYIPLSRQVNEVYAVERASRIAASDKVYITSSGSKYHRPYHYRDRSEEISLYEATEADYQACKTCTPARAVELVSRPAWYLSHYQGIAIAVSAAYIFTVGFALKKLPGKREM